MMPETTEDGSDTNCGSQIAQINAVNPRHLNGSLLNENSNSMHWSCNGFLAFGSHNKVIVVAAKNQLRVCQTLEKHKYAVKTIRWITDNSMKLLSCDVNGNIIVWDANEGLFLTMITADSKEMKHLLNVAWICNEMESNKEDAHNYILALYNGNNLVLYDSENGEIVWKKNFGNPSTDDYFAKRFSVDPFNRTNIILTLEPSSPKYNDCCFAVVRDVMQTKVNLKRYMIQLSSNADSTPGSPSKAIKIRHTIKEMGNSLTREDEASALPNYLLEYNKIVFNQCTRNQVFLLCPREILLIDLDFVQILTVVNIERNCSNFVDMYSCFNRNMIYCLHDNGTISSRLLQKKKKREEHIGSDLMEISYSTLCLSDGVRLTKNHKIVGFSVCPISEINVAVLLNNSKIFVFKLCRRGMKQSISKKSTLNVDNLNILISLQDYELSDKDSEIKRYALIMNKWLGAISSGPHVIRMCPPLTMRNWKIYKPYLAIGDTSGIIQIYNLASNLLEKEFSIHNSPVRGIEWASLGAFLSFSHQNIQGHSGRVCNELYLIDVSSGRSEALRVEANKDSSPIEALKVSHLKQYFILALKNEPFEIWDLKRLTLLQVMAKHTPLITAVEWSPLYNKKSVDEKDVQVDGTFTSESKYSPVKENFVVTNANSELHHFSVEGKVVKQVSSTPDLNGPTITSISWKSDHLLLGDADGNLNVWSLKDRVTKAEGTNRGWIKKMRFAPGRGNMKCLILFNDGVDVWDIKEMSRTAQLKFPRDISSKIQDIDWAGSDRPILSLSDDSILIGDIKLKRFNSPITTAFSDLPQIPINPLTQANFLLLPVSQKFLLETKMIHKLSEDEEVYPDCIVKRSLLLAKLKGEKQWIRFWELTLHHIIEDLECDTNYELFLNIPSFRSIQEEKVALYEYLRNSLEHNHICCDHNLWLGNHQRSIQLLLETDPQLKDAYSKDSLKACIIALLNSISNENQSAHPVLKLVATNLIANESIDEGIQLLAMINKAKDACRYLQSHGFWERAVFAAKLHLKDGEDYAEIMNSWIKHLEATNQLDIKLFALLSMKMNVKVIEFLKNLNEIQKAAIFIDALKSKGLLENDSIVLVKDVYSSYINMLKKAGLTDICNEYELKLKECENIG
ncbi:WD repeat-containing protein 11-like protein [Dinothrombium tinctorium]|uniref:WD repeat-containing protein 11-like protein n=1 Tax=Dinothrombium tinctorium TaxID=1965070 RepID=A0A3S3P599_9ACAR|nr:WD repeat-containing protein 11-like protein [Dinothrombium tinctorium]RWS15230.1 WD repeat-containing protein 11-like protein [Dinothrombium tinctorium]RWS15239.1 WD repeat-containing protein 11-like protein [Dinothrombium tinctorium]